MEEIWKDIVGYEGQYKVSNYGVVKSVARKVLFQRWNRISYAHYPERLIKLFVSKKGYMVAFLSNYSKTSTQQVHRLVAQAFIPNYENKPQVNHIDANKKNNWVSNLEWATQVENMNHGKTMNLFKGMKGDKNPMFGKRGDKNHNFGGKSPNAKKVIQKTMDGDIVKIWDSSMDIKRNLGIPNKQISRCLLGEKENTNGFKWAYA